MSLGFMIMYKFTYYQKQFHKPKMHEYKLLGKFSKGACDHYILQLIL